MFKNLTDLAYRRNKKEALGFYLASLFSFTMAGAIVVIIAALIMGANLQALSGTIPPQAGQVGGIVVAIGSAVLSLMILSAKKDSRYGYVLLALTAGMISFFAGDLFGFIIPALLTTMHVRE